MGPDGMCIVRLCTYSVLISTCLCVFSVIWTRRNPAPWLTVEQGETTKLGTKLGARKDVSGIPQHIWDKRYEVLISIV